MGCGEGEEELEGVRRCQKMKAGLKEGRISFLPSLFANKPRYVSPSASVHRLPFLTLHVSVRDEDGDGEGEEEGAHDFAPPRTDPASRRRRRIRVRHRGFRSIEGQPQLLLTRFICSARRRGQGAPFTTFCILEFPKWRHWKHAPSLFLAAESLLFTFTIFLAVKSSDSLCGF